ncbi:hypothetical protein IU510_27215 [Nocardia cyriacigeorgica]|uniref:hypothetical protein n=1 Tax=Nocardia cyriacigeorgica TaxID=135487 RepID=UPI00189486E7|nr:hypothetical protein [Nocardia cyriacigeorgica]MBF6101714.1 hypothetical protein [Nocardia cyriacigeorgica]
MNLDEFFRQDIGPRIARSSDIPAVAVMVPAARRDRWARSSLAPTLAKVSRLLADLDLSAITHGDDAVVLSFLAGVTEEVRRQAITQLERGNAILHPISLLVAIKEIIEYADETAGTDDESVPSDDELLAMLLTIADEVNEAAMPPHGVTFDGAMLELAVNRVAQASLLFPDPLEFLSTSTANTWQRSWSSRTAPKTLVDLADCPAAEWKRITGIALEDFLSLGWLFYNLWRNEGFKQIEEHFFEEFKVAPEAVDFFIEHCTLSVAEMRALLSRERGSDASLWARYKLQQHPFVRLDDGSLLPVRFQFAIQRFFGDHLYLESHNMLRERDPKQADHYAAAMRDIFEERVGEVLDRVCSYDTSGATVLVEEKAMKQAWRTNKGKLPKICDFVVFRDHGCILIDANMRNLPQPFAEGSGTFEALQEEIRTRYTETKFGQLLSTVELFLTRGWNKAMAKVTHRTRFVPLVVVPDAGLPGELTVENLVFTHAFSSVRKFNDNPNVYRVSVPAIVTWRDLLMLDGLAEHGIDIFVLLKRWRNIGPSGTSMGREPLPVPLREYVDEKYPGTAVLSQAEHRRGFEFFEYLREHISQRAVSATPPHQRAALSAYISQQLSQRPTWESRRDYLND